MKPDVTPEEWEETNRIVQSLMMRNALLHRDAADARTVTILQDNGLLMDAEPGSISEHTISVLQDVNHPDRLPLVPGPMIWHRDQGTDQHRSVIPVQDYLFSIDQGVRIAALRHFEGLKDADPKVLGQKSKDIIAQYGDRLRSSDASSWRRAAILIADAVSDDFLCNLAGAKQGLQAGLRQVIYLPKILRPSVSSLLALEQPLLKPSEQMGEIEQMIGDCVSASSLEEACSLYYHLLGHLPLAGRLSLVRVVSDWVEQNGAPEEVWSQVWEWADEIPSPLPRYHACSVFVQRPDLVPPDGSANLWNEIVEIVHMPQKERHLKCSQAWQLRLQSARHYASYIESNLPGMDGERIAASSWWLAEQVSTTLEVRPEVMNYLLNEEEPNDLGISRLVHAVSHPPITPSNFRYATLYLPSLWSFCLQCLIGPTLDDLDPSSAHDDVLATIGGAIVRSILARFPARAKAGDQVAYSFEQPLAPAASIWHYLADDSQDKRLLMTVKPDHEAQDDQQIADFLKTMAAFVPEMQQFVAADLLVRAYTDEIPVDAVWEWVSAKEWIREVLLTADLNALGLLLDALLEIQVQQGGKWASQLPHVLAIACEEAVDDNDRQEFLFGATLVASMVSDRVSAIQRLVNSRDKQRYQPEIDHWRTRLQELQELSPSWIAAKMRATLASLHSV